MRSREVARQKYAGADSLQLLPQGARSGTSGKHDLLEDILDVYQRKAAQRMVEDFETAGVDEDLEALRAGWASNFKARPGRAQPRRPLLADLSGQEVEEEDEFAEARSILAAQGERAQQRLQGLQQLRRLASGEQRSYSYTPTETGGSCPALLANVFPTTAAPAPPPAAPSQPARRTTLKSKPAAAAPRDPWAEWEARWSEEFNRFEELERMRQRSVWDSQAAEAREREAEWHRRVQAEKERAAHDAARNADKRSQKRPPEASKKEEPKSTGWLPPKPPRPEPAAKSSAGRAFASFDDFGAAWQAFEQRLAAGSQKGLLTAADIPWPHSLPSVSGATVSDGAAEAKKKLRTALIRWHPDKWAPILEHVVEDHRADVLSRVKEVTQRLLEEKKRFDGK